MLTRFLIIPFMLAFAVAFAQAADRLQLNLRLHPVQTLSIGNTESNSVEKEIPTPDYLVVSSVSGFQVHVKREMYTHRDKKVKKNHGSMEYYLIDNPKGVMHKKYIINQNIENIIKKTGSPVAENELLVFTIISK